MKLASVVLLFAAALGAQSVTITLDSGKEKVSSEKETYTIHNRGSRDLLGVRFFWLRDGRRVLQELQWKYPGGGVLVPAGKSETIPEIVKGAVGASPVGIEAMFSGQEKDQGDLPSYHRMIVALREKKPVRVQYHDSEALNYIGYALVLENMLLDPSEVAGVAHVEEPESVVHPDAFPPSPTVITNYPVAGLSPCEIALLQGTTTYPDLPCVSIAPTIQSVEPFWQAFNLNAQRNSASPLTTTAQSGIAYCGSHGANQDLSVQRTISSACTNPAANVSMQQLTLVTAISGYSGYYGIGVDSFGSFKSQNSQGYCAQSWFCGNPIPTTAGACGGRC